jgi:hypothetical protein
MLADLSVEWALYMVIGMNVGGKATRGVKGQCCHRNGPPEPNYTEALFAAGSRRSFLAGARAKG